MQLQGEQIVSVGAGGPDSNQKAIFKEHDTVENNHPLSMISLV